MALALTIGISVLLLVLTLLGYARDLRRGTIALLGTLAGAALVDFWGVRWGNSLASRLVEGDQARTTLLVSCLLFLWSVLVVGYGGGMLLARPKERPVGQRMAGALLGLVNGLLIVGFLLRYATAQASFATTVKADLLANLINTAMPWLFLGAAAVVTVLVIGRGAMSLLGRPAAPPRRPTAPPPAAPRPSAGSAPAAGSAERRIGSGEALDKVNDALRQQGR